MHRFHSLALLMALWFARSHAFAQGGTEAEAKTLFQEGVALSQQGHWLEAAEHFERSLVLEDRPATRFNLIWAYAALEQPLDVVRHALSFLSLPSEPHRADARIEAEAALLRATQELATLSTEGLPAEWVFVDGAAPQVRDAARLYLKPGKHRLELKVQGLPNEVVELELRAGQALPWPRMRPIDAHEAQEMSLDVAASDPEKRASPRLSLADPSTHARGPHIATTDRRDSTPPRHRWVWTWTLSGAGVGALATGSGLLLAAYRKSQAYDACDPDTENCDPIASTGKRVYLASILSFSAAGLLATGAMAAFVFERRRSSIESQTSVLLGPSQLMLRRSF